jgi:hypothetical protein
MIIITKKSLYKHKRHQSNVFFEEIKDWDTWAKIFQDIPAFEKLINKIFEK